MKLKLEMFLAGLVLGRIALHVVTLAMDGKLRWHVAGIAREFKPMAEPQNWGGTRRKFLRMSNDGAKTKPRRGWRKN